MKSVKSDDISAYSVPRMTCQRPRFVEARSDEQSRKERQRRQMMTEEEVAEETARRLASERVKQVETH